MNSVQLIQSVIIDNNVLDCWVEKSLNRNGLNNASNNCTFHIPNGFRDKKRKNQKAFYSLKKHERSSWAYLKNMLKRLRTIMKWSSLLIKYLNGNK